MKRMIENKRKELCKFNSVRDYLEAVNLEAYLDEEFNIGLDITTQQHLDWARLNARSLTKYNIGE